MSSNIFYNGYGMMYLNIPSISVSSNTISSNGASNDGNTGVFVLGISSTSYSIIFTSTTFKNNYSQNGAVVYVEGSGY
jgi:hypothetical protein